MFINTETPHSQFEWGVFLFIKITQKELKIISVFRNAVRARNLPLDLR